MRKTSAEILNWIDNHKKYVYWYGGKRQKCSKALAELLQKQNPKVWTESYKEKAMADVAAGAFCCDCSGFVCGAYNIADKGTAQFSSVFVEYAGEPKAGMVAWKRGHCGIFLADGWNAPIAEMRGIDYDYCETRTYKTAGFAKVYNMDGVMYMGNDDENIGWHKDATGWWYRHKKGKGESTYHHDCFRVINGHVYCFDSDGYIVEKPARYRDGGMFFFSGEANKRVNPESSAGWWF